MLRATAGPELRVRIGGHFVGVEFLVFDQHLKLGDVNVVIDLLFLRQLRAGDRLDLLQRVFPIMLAHVLRGLIHLGQMCIDTLVVLPPELRGAPRPFLRVDRGELRIRACLRRFRGRRLCGNRCRGDENGHADTGNKGLHRISPF